MAGNKLLLASIFFLFMAVTFAFADEVCYNGVQSLPVTCSPWGTITSDTFDGCRYVTCSDTTGDHPGEYYTAKACDKPGSNNPTTIELYSAGRQGFAGTEICFASACISSGIPYKSYSYPLCSGNTTPPVCTPSAEVCDQNDNDCDGQVDEDNVCTSGDVCYNSVKDIPVTCEGAAITSDTWDGGRHITCGTTTIAAWNKNGFFEMYKQTGGNNINICLGNTCIKEAGFAQSSNFPICIGGPTYCTYDGVNYTEGQSFPAGDSCNTCVCGSDGRVMCTMMACPSTNQTCYSSLNDLPANCTGTITSDVKEGCRTIACSSGSGSVDVRACEKTDSTAKYFEIYRQSSTGTQPVVCIGSDCLKSGWGYERGDYFPVCMTTQTNQTNTSGSATIAVLQSVSAEHNVVFSCDPGFNATQFNWTFSDGSTFNKTDSADYQHKETLADVYHTFPGNGTYTVSCLATNGTSTASGTTDVTIVTRATPVEIAQAPIFNLVNITRLHGNTYSITCGAVGANTIAADWWLTGNGLWYMPNGFWETTLTFTFNEQKNYSGYCDTAMDFTATSDYFNTGYLQSPCSAPYLCNLGTGAASSSFSIAVSQSDNGSLHGGIYATQISGLTYEFWCNMPSFGGPYDAEFGDGNHTYQWPARFNHTYAQPGNYSITCHYDSNPSYGGPQASWTTGLVLEVTDAPPQNVGATLSVAPSYPQGNNYVFNCDANGFTPTLYDYTFGDGQSWSNVTFNNTFHTYQNGTYDVTCTAKNSQVSATGTLGITVGTTPPPTTCYNSVQTIPATCTGGSITTDTSNGCRTIICTNGDSNMQVLACDKSGPARFEMYKQGRSGTAVSKICLGTTCISNNGYASSDYPYCI